MKQLIERCEKYFGGSQLVCGHVAQKYSKAQIWSFMDPRLLVTLLALRERIIAKPMVINNGTFTQRGLRCNRCQLVQSKSTPYLTAHLRGQAVDFDVPGMSAEEVRRLVVNNQELLPYPIRVEKDVNWVHIDVCNTTDQKIVQFNG